MKHLGDITKINGAEAPVVEVIIGGSPCQDLSVAGKRAGLDGERSGLFMEQIRVIKEMREHDRAGGRTDELVRPRFMVWENVPGAFSSNKGEDFRTVLEATARVANETAAIPRPPKGKWTNAGAVMGDGWSIAWRVFDAQFWGVPQRRKRIALVADFGGHAAPEVLFEREGVQGHTDESGAQRERTAGDTETGADKAVVYGISAYESNAMKSGNPHSGVYVAETARTLDNNGGSPACNQGGMAVVQSSGFKYRNGGKTRSIGYHKEQIPTLGTDGNEAILIHDARGNGDGSTAPTITGDHENRITDYTAVVYSIDRAAYNQGMNAKYDIGIDNSGTAQTIVSKGPNTVCIGNGQPDQLDMSEKVGALNCMHDQQAVMIKEDNNATGTQNKVLHILQETYGEKAVVEWGTAILAALQQSEVLQQGVHDICDERETESWNELDDGSLPCPKLVTRWLLRDLWKHEKCGCPSQRQQSAEQRNQQSSKVVQVLPCESAQECKEMFNMWQKSEGLWILRKALSEIQEIRKSSCGKEKRNYCVVRRLTPLEAERLQGYPDYWTHIGDWTDSKGKKHKDADSPKYKALGNSIALPNWEYVLSRLNAYCKEHTMASLFDGIGGFPLIWERLNGRGSCLWASEIEEFPMAVTRLRFGGEQ